MAVVNPRLPHVPTCTRPGCGGASIILLDAHAVFACDCGAHSIVALMASSAAEIELLGDYD